MCPMQLMRISPSFWWKHETELFPSFTANFTSLLCTICRLINLKCSHQLISMEHNRITVTQYPAICQCMTLAGYRSVSCVASQFIWNLVLLNLADWTTNEWMKINACAVYWWKMNILLIISWPMAILDVKTKMHFTKARHALADK